MAQKPAQYNIGDRVMVVGTISGTPDGGSIVGPYSVYEVKVDNSAVDYTYAFRFSALSPEKEPTPILKSNGNDLPYFTRENPSFPFSDKISEINIKYK